jgi:hypothetical protein
MKYLIRNTTTHESKIADGGSPEEACASLGWGKGECQITELPRASKEEPVKGDWQDRRPYLVVHNVTGEDWKGFANSPEDAAKQAGWPPEQCDIVDLWKYQRRQV